MDWQDRIEKVPGVLSGKPIIRGMRLSVEQIVGHLKGGWSEEEIIAAYGVTVADIEACRQFAATGEPLSPMTWAEWEAAVFGDDDQRREQIVSYCERHRDKALQTSDWQYRIEKVPGILRGKPIIKGTRISVELIVGYLAGGAWTEEDVLTNYPGITLEDIEACRQFAAAGEPLYAMTSKEFEAAVFGDHAKPNKRKAQ